GCVHGPPGPPPGGAGRWLGPRVRMRPVRHAEPRCRRLLPGLGHRGAAGAGPHRGNGQPRPGRPPRRLGGRLRLAPATSPAALTTRPVHPRYLVTPARVSGFTYAPTLRPRDPAGQGHMSGSSVTDGPRDGPGRVPRDAASTVGLAWTYL